MIMMSFTPVHSKVDVVSRTNYGVLYHQLSSDLGISEFFWPHTFQIVIPDVNFIEVNHGFKCAPDRGNKFEICQEVEKIFLQMKTMRNEIESRIRGTMDLVNSVMPIEIKNVTVKKGRMTRSILPFIGELSRTLFGTATLRDTERLRLHVNRLTETENRLVKGFQKANEDLSSYMVANNHQVESILAAVKLNHKEIDSLQGSFDHSVSSLTKLLASTVTMLINHTTALSHISNVMSSLYMGIHTVIDGKLSPHLVTPHIISQCIENIKDHLAASNPEFHLVYQQVSHYYQNSRLVYARNGNSIFVTVKFPVSNQKHTFSLFQVQTFPIPVNHSTTHVTQLINKPAYFAVSKDLKHFVELEYATFEQCEGDKVKHCPNLLAQQLSKNPTCISAIFFKQFHMVSALCDFNYIHDGLTSFIIKIDNNRMLISNVPRISYFCQTSKRQHVEGCLFCILQIPCHCSISAGKWYLPPQMKGCIHHINTTKVYTVNLAVLHNFFQYDQFNTIQADTVVSKEFNFTVPPFQIYEHNFSKIMATGKDTHLNLKAMAQLAKQNNVIYKSLSDSFLSGEISPTSTYSVWQLVLTWLPILLSVCSMVATTLFWCQSKSSSALFLAQSIPKTQALPQLIWQPSTSTTPNTPVGYISMHYVNMYLPYIHFLLLCTIVMLLICIIAKLIKRRSTVTKLYIEITNATSSVTVHLINLRLSPIHYDISASNPIAKVCMYRNVCNLMLNITWNDTHVWDNYNECMISIPTQIRLNPIQWFQVSSILCGKYKVNLSHIFNGAYQTSTVIANSSGIETQNPSVELINRHYPNLEEEMKASSYP